MNILLITIIITLIITLKLLKEKELTIKELMKRNEKGFHMLQEMSSISDEIAQLKKELYDQQFNEIRINKLNDHIDLLKVENHILQNKIKKLEILYKPED